MMDELLKECREKIREIEVRMEFLQKHNFQEEVRVLQTKVGGMFQIYDMLRAYYEEAKGK